MADDIAIKVNGVSKTFKLPHEKQSSIKSALINFKHTKRGYEKQQVLNDVSFEIKKGEFFGIVGRNGSGKSTLLKLLAGIYTPDKGSIIINGKLTPFIELGVGFNPELSGRENVFLNGALLGFNRKEMADMYDEIVAFAELERFMDQKLKNYSSGMQVRLAFSIAIKANSEILLLDEVLAVGDSAFQQKCYTYFANLKSSNSTVVLVTHDMDAVEKFCDRALLIETGKIRAISQSAEIAKAYRQLFANRTSRKEKGVISKAINNVGLRVMHDAKAAKIIQSETQFDILIDVDMNCVIEKAAIGINIADSTGIIVCSFGIGGMGEQKIGLGKGSNSFKLHVYENILHNDTYYIDVIIEDYSAHEHEILYSGIRAASFISTGYKLRDHALVHLSHEFIHDGRRGKRLVEKQ